MGLLADMLGKKIFLVAALSMVALAMAGSIAIYLRYQTVTVYDCEWKKVSGKGTDEDFEISESAHLQLHLQGQHDLQQLIASSGMHQGYEGGYGECSLHWQAGQKPVHYQLKQAKNKFSLSSETERFELQALKTGFRFTIIKADSANCGMGWNWPRSIELQHDKKACIVRH